MSSKFVESHSAETAVARSPLPIVNVPELTVVIPTFNEWTNIPIVIERLDRALVGVAWEAIFVDDDSPDGTAMLAKQIGAQGPRVRCIRRLGRRGLAGACIEGMLASQAPYLAILDADLQHDESLLTDMLALLRGDAADIVVGARTLKDMAEVPGLSANRLAASQLTTRFLRRLLGIQIADPMSGSFMVKRDMFEELAPRLSAQGFKILADILVSAPHSLRVRELPYTFRPRVHGKSKLDTRVTLDFIGLMVAKTTRDAIPVRFLSFMLVGATGIVVHLIALSAALEGFGVDFAFVQTFATLVSMPSNFFLNNMLTYHDQRLSGLTAAKGLVLFHMICTIGAISNIGVANWLYANKPCGVLPDSRVRSSARSGITRSRAPMYGGRQGDRRPPGGIGVCIKRNQGFLR